MFHEGRVKLLGQGQNSFRVPKGSILVYPNGSNRQMLESIDGDSIEILKELSFRKTSDSNKF